MKKFLVFIYFVSFMMHAKDDLHINCDAALKEFIAIDSYNNENYDAMHAIFTSMNMGYKKLLSTISGDIVRCCRYIKRQVNNNVVAAEYSHLIDQMRLFVKYVKQHKHCWDALQCHDDLRKRYALVFNDQKIVQSVNAAPHLYGISDRCKNKSKAYFDQVVMDLSKISKFEDYLHGDYSILKAHNYVFKIELIRVRNVIYHNNLYKYETSYF